MVRRDVYPHEGRAVVLLGPGCEDLMLPRGILFWAKCIWVLVGSCLTKKNLHSYWSCSVQPKVKILPTNHKKIGLSLSLMVGRQTALGMAEREAPPLM